MEFDSPNQDCVRSYVKFFIWRLLGDKDITSCYS